MLILHLGYHFGRKKSINSGPNHTWKLYQQRQVFIALISNACDAVSEESGQLTLRSKLCQVDGSQYAAVEFSDNGAGIATDMLTKIFEPFVTTKPFGQGTGLGLAVCYGIISDHGGRIEVTSQPGRGTTMNVLLPITETPPTIRIPIKN